jgi:signal transduction histidine kinase
MIDRAPDRLKETLEYVRSLAQVALAEMRSVILRLRPSFLDTEGLTGAITRLAETINAGGSMNIRLDLCPEPELSHDAKEAVYRICQEALHNATRHARTEKVTLRLVGDRGQTVLEVIDNGIGFDAALSFPGHIGLESIRERASVFGGSLEIESAPGRGTCVRARIPTAGSRA